MAKTYAQISREIQAMQAEAERIRNREVAEVVSRITEAIRTYGLTEQDLFGSSRKGAGTKVAAKKKSARSGGAPKYSDAAGNSWGGMGPRPRWLREALASGKKLEDFLGGNAAARREPQQENAAASQEAAATSPSEGASSKRAPGKKAAAKKRTTSRSEAD
jgi:DNA-binding protein H-NS